MLANVTTKHLEKSLTINDFQYIFSTYKAKQTQTTLKQKSKPIHETANVIYNSVLSQVRYYIKKTMDNKREPFERELININAIHSFDGKVHIVDNITEVIGIDKISFDKQFSLNG